MGNEKPDQKVHTPRPMRPEDTSYGDVIVHFSDQPVKPKYWFEDFGDYWSCSCGQINRSDTCSNCGLERELLRRLFQGGGLGTSAGLDPNRINSLEDLPYGDDPSDIPDAHEGGHSTPQHEDPGPDAATGYVADRSIHEGGGAHDGGEHPSGYVADDGDLYDKLAEERELADYNKRKRRTRRLMVFLVMLILMLGGGLAAFYYYGLPEMNRQEDMQADAVKDSLLAELPGIVTPLGETEFDIDRNLGDFYYDGKKYEKAIEYYTKALKIKDDESLRHKINAAKFSYVSTHREEGGAVFEDYLEDLFKAKYSGVQDIYYSYYSWKASIVVNTGANDYSTDMSSINRVNPIYFHTTFSGGPPNEELDLYYEIVWPDGTSERKAVSGSKGSGETLTTTCQYTFPATPNEGRLTYKLFNNSNNKQIASDSVSLL